MRLVVLLIYSISNPSIHPPDAYYQITLLRQNSSTWPWTHGQFPGIGGDDYRHYVSGYPRLSASQPPDCKINRGLDAHLFHLSDWCGLSDCADHVSICTLIYSCGGNLRPVSWSMNINPSTWYRRNESYS